MKKIVVERWEPETDLERDRWIVALTLLDRTSDEVVHVTGCDPIVVEVALTHYGLLVKDADGCERYAITSFVAEALRIPRWIPRQATGVATAKTVERVSNGASDFHA